MSIQYLKYVNRSHTINSYTARLHKFIKGSVEGIGWSRKKIKRNAESVCNIANTIYRVRETKIQPV